MLELTGVSVGYGPVTVVRDLNLSVKEGGSVFIVGPNGAGKTTLIRAIAGLNRLKGGRVTWLGEDLSRLAPHKRARAGLAVVPEGRHVFPELTVLENLDVAARAVTRRDVQKRVADAMSYFPRLQERRNQLAGLLSGGEQQMLAIARALAQNPKMLVIDELSLGLAPVVSEEVGRAVKTLAAGGLAVLLVEQNASLAMRIGSEGHLMSGGRIELSGSADYMRGHESMQELYLGGLEAQRSLA